MLQWQPVTSYRLSPNFLLLVSLISHSRARFEHVFYKTYNKSEGLYREERQDFEGLLIFLHMKMSAKSNKIELSEEFMATRREEQTHWDVISPLHRNKNEKKQKFEKDVR